ncbi:MAG TPA: hypothetical protein ENK70_00305 [Methylophaga sp.]|nr:hypothetical protein [Methylophaga sp.]
MEFINMFSGFIKYILTNSYWWLGYYVGALMFFSIGVNWHLLSKTHEWYAVGVVGGVCLIGILLTRGT